MIALVNGKIIGVECTKRLHEDVLVPFPVCGCESQVFVGKNRYRFRALKMDN